MSNADRGAQNGSTIFSEVAFVIHQSVTSGIEELKAKIIEHEGEILDDIQTATYRPWIVVIADPAHLYDTQNLDVLRDRMLLTPQFSGIFYGPEKRNFMVERIPFIKRCIRKQIFLTPKEVPQQQQNENSRDGRLRVEFTEEDDENLAKFLLLKFPDKGSFGKQSHLVYSHLSSLYDPNDPSFSWVGRHTAASWRERYRKNVDKFEDMLDRLREEQLGEADNIQLAGRWPGRRKGKVRIFTSDSEEEEEEVREREEHVQQVAQGDPGTTNDRDVIQIHDRDTRHRQRKRPRPPQSSSSNPKKRRRIDNYNTRQVNEDLDIRNPVSQPNTTAIRREEEEESDSEPERAPPRLSSEARQDRQRDLANEGLARQMEGESSLEEEDGAEVSEGPDFTHDQGYQDVIDPLPFDHDEHVGGLEEDVNENTEILGPDQDQESQAVEGLLLLWPEEEESQDQVTEQPLEGEKEQQELEKEPEKDIGQEIGQEAVLEQELEQEPDGVGEQEVQVQELELDEEQEQVREQKQEGFGDTAEVRPGSGSVRDEDEWPLVTSTDAESDIDMSGPQAGADGADVEVITTTTLAITTASPTLVARSIGPDSNIEPLNTEIARSSPRPSTPTVQKRRMVPVVELTSFTKRSRKLHTPTHPAPTSEGVFRNTRARSKTRDITAPVTAVQEDTHEVLSEIAERDENVDAEDYSDERGIHDFLASEIGLDNIEDEDMDEDDAQTDSILSAIHISRNENSSATSLRGQPVAPEPLSHPTISNNSEMGVAAMIKPEEDEHIISEERSTEDEVMQRLQRRGGSSFKLEGSPARLVTRRSLGKRSRVRTPATNFPIVPLPNGRRKHIAALPVNFRAPAVPKRPSPSGSDNSETSSAGAFPISGTRAAVWAEKDQASPFRPLLGTRAARKVAKRR